MPASRAFTTDGEFYNNVNHKVMTRKLRQFFSAREQGYIEALFEGESSFIGGQSRDLDSAPAWVATERARYDKMEKLQELLQENLSDDERLTLLMQAVVDLADVRINLDNLRDWFYIELPVNKLLTPYRDQFGL